METDASDTGFDIVLMQGLGVRRHSVGSWRNTRMHSDACMQIHVHARSQVPIGLHVAACCPIYLRLHVLVLDDGFPATGGTSSAGNC